MYHGYSRYIRIICTYIKKNRMVLIILNGDSTSFFPDVEYFFLVFTDPREKTRSLGGHFLPPDPKNSTNTLKKSDTLRFSTEYLRFVYVCPIGKNGYPLLCSIEPRVYLIIPSWLCHPFGEAKCGWILRWVDTQKKHKEPTASNWTPKIRSFLIDQVTENFNEEIAIES